MGNFVFIKDKEPRVRTFDIFKGLGYSTHADLKRVVRAHEKEFKEMGVLVLERCKPLQGTVGGRPSDSYLLNEKQFAFLMMLVKNTQESVEIKKRIVEEFFRMREELSKYIPNRMKELDAVRALLLLDSPSEWERLYPDEYYIALMKLYRDEFTSFKGGLPGYCGNITKRWIYDVVLPEELRKETLATPGTKRHQWFHKQNGREALIRQIGKVTMLARISQSRKDFESRCATIFLGAPLQLSVFL
jgi:phage regulator Rha-like protein